MPALEAVAVAQAVSLLFRLQVTCLMFPIIHSLHKMQVHPETEL